jgi:hypothetical protein
VFGEPVDIVTSQRSCLRDIAMPLHDLVDATVTIGLVG